MSKVHGNVLRLLKAEPELVSGEKGGRVDGSSKLGQSRVLGVYFAAQWCPSCRDFTPRLRSFYEAVRTAERDALDVVFVSWDEDEQAFEEHAAQMPWPAIPFNDARLQATPGTEQKPIARVTNRRVQLARMLRVHSIPTLVLLEGNDGRVITHHGRRHVTEDPQGLQYPWRPPPISSFLHRGDLLIAAGSPAHKDPSELNGNVTCVYFSANWCPPCKAFTPQLVDTYSSLKSKGVKFEVVFVSSDRSQESFDHYFATMPWLAIPFAEERRRKDLATLLGINGIPTLVVLDENHKVLTRDGRYEVMEDPDGNNFPWRPQLVQELTAKHSSQLNEDPLVVLFTDGNDKELEQGKGLLLPVAQELVTQHQDTVLWFYVGGETDICDLVREEAMLVDEVPLLVILDMANKEKFVFDEDVELTEDIVREFVLSYLDGELRPRPFRE